MCRIGVQKVGAHVLWVF